MQRQRPDRPAPADWRELAWIAPVGTAVLFLPPVLTLFDVQRTVFGIPVLLIYLLCVWVGAIAVSALVARRSLRGAGRSGD